MKIHRTMAAAATTGALALGLALPATGTANASAPAKEAGDSHRLYVRLENMHLVDDESNWDGPFDDGKTAEVGNYGPEIRTIVLTHGSPSGQVVFSHCAGGEVRGLLVINLRLQSDDQVAVSPVLSLYEGTSCSTTDLDGRTYAQPYTLGPGAVTTRRFSAPSTAEGGLDSASATYSIRHPKQGGPKVLRRG
ncbi:hypothetical protein HS041_15990 [Planomonospora sp. ID67723]|uniref:hypothetical protein n=1 Tax=Planomonospora sp. ID67723 TaxID=2738134 RepID=UPI0018C44414|nr:hypothetical protein [Planomonospora sp. ID67723]MBG0829268.1 hypothetical protein [Planomonospora sp. ID67723]